MLYYGVLGFNIRWRGLDNMETQIDLVFGPPCKDRVGLFQKHSMGAIYNRKENGNYYSTLKYIEVILGIYWDNGK